ncbi:hypothetical protein L5G28_08560 [Gordonia sp. HY285]|uniref:hypothetical protein n=1 Tax=Gordonia liuliyuniae TaxID=2911517 RepID=UPI001F22F44E|nr:hypothetical protein [Gordonia liuliyuniae]MCF8610209.1 hypothetical protein [Gordonia liuliyuniae]
MKYGIYVAGRAGTTSAKPDSPERIASAVDDLMGGSPHVIREYIHFLGADPDPALVRSLGADDELTGLTMPDEWYLQNERELDLVVSYLPSAEEIPDGWRFSTPSWSVTVTSSGISKSPWNRTSPSH